jgi:hypothetical protein
MRDRRALWAVLAGIVAGAAAVAAVAGSGAGGGPRRLPPLALGGTAAATGAERGDAKAALFPVPGEVRYEVAGELPNLPERAPAWTVGSEASTGRVRELARALGLDGEVRSEPDAWVVRDGTRELRVTRVPGLPWYYQADAPEPCVEPAVPPGPDQPVSSGDEAARREKATDCVVVDPGVVSSGGASAGTAPTAATTDGGANSSPSGGTAGRAEPGAAEGAEPAGTGEPPAEPPPPATVEPCPMPPCPPGVACIQRCGTEEPTRPADLPTPAEAERQARDLLGRVGLDLAGAQVSVDDGFSALFVYVRPALGGLPVVGWDWSVAIGPKGSVVSASGWLARPTRGDDYPLAGLAAGLERLRTNRWFGYPGPVPLGAPETLIAPEVGCDEVRVLDPRMVRPTEPGAGDCPPPEPIVRMVTGVRLGLLFAPAAEPGGDGAWFVPVYLFTLDGSEEVPVVAVTDDLLPPPPSPEPSPEPREPGVGADPAGPAE